MTSELLTFPFSSRRIRAEVYISNRCARPVATSTAELDPPPSSSSPSQPTAVPTEQSLQRLLTRIGTSATPLSLLPPDLVLLISSFTKEIPARTRSLGFLILAQLAQPSAESGSPDDANTLGDVFASKLEDVLLETKADELERALTFLSALLQAGQSAGIAILARPGFMGNLYDLTDLYLTSKSADNVIPRALADVLSQASNTKQGRTALASSPWIPWLERQTTQTEDATLRATAAVALTKLSRGGGSAEDALAAAEPAQEGGAGGSAQAEETETDKGRRDLKLATMMVDLVTSYVPPKSSGSTEPPPSSVLSAIEGLAFTSLRGPIKELLASSSLFLTKLFALIPPPPSARSFANPISIPDAPAPPQSSSAPPPALAYGVAAILSNLASYRPQLTAEQAQLDRLRRMTTAAKKPAVAGGKGSGGAGMDVPDQDPLDDDRRVSMRARKVLDAGATPVLVSLARSESRAVRDIVGRCLLSLVEVQSDRGLIIQQGGSKALLAIIYHSLPPLPATTKSASSTTKSKAKTTEPATQVDETTLPALQALAKLTITTSPFALFGPSPTASFTAIRPLALLLLHDSSTLLQQFEALMGLTNLASLGPELADRIAAVEAGKVVRRTEELMLEENKLVKRAATELVCNLLSSDGVFEMFSGEENAGAGQAGGAAPPYTPAPTATATPPASPTSTIPSKHSSSSPAVSKLHVLLALSSSYDLPTRLASSACLATLTSSPIACSLLLLPRPKPSTTSPIDLILDLLRPVPSDEEEAEEGINGGEVDEGLVHRGMVVLRNVLGHGGGKEVGRRVRERGGREVLEGLLGVGKVGQGGEVGQLVRECLGLMEGR